MRKKMLVEECIPIKITELTRHGLLHADAHASAKAVYGSKVIAHLEVNCTVAEPFARLTYSWNEAPEKWKDVDSRIALTTTKARFGGVRWWFLCPLMVNNKPCGRRVANLYLQRGNPYFACRQCHGLTYKSSQQSHKDEARWRALAKQRGSNWRKLRKAHSQERGNS